MTGHNPEIFGNSAPSRVRLQPQFSGETAEFSRLWLRNALFTLLSLGLYAGVARASNRRYLYQHTALADSRFDYTADTAAACKRLLPVVLLLLCYIAASAVKPEAGAMLVLLALAGWPWFAKRSLQFRAQMTQWHDTAFQFNGSTLTAYKNTAVAFLIIIFTAGMALPQALWQYHQFAISNLQFGQTRFHFTAEAGRFARWYLMLVITGGLALGAIFILPLMLEDGMKAEALFHGTRGRFTAIAGFSTLFFLLSWAQTSLRNVVWSNIQLGDDTQLHCKLSVFKMLWLHASNLLAVLGSVGLLAPWAILRVRRYRVACLSVETTQLQ